jgi:hypothetical protein
MSGPAAAHGPARAACFGGQTWSLYEQNTQQSPGNGRNVVPHPLHV